MTVGLCSVPAPYTDNCIIYCRAPAWQRCYDERDTATRFVSVRMYVCPFVTRSYCVVSAIADAPRDAVRHADNVDGVINNGGRSV